MYLEMYLKNAQYIAMFYYVASKRMSNIPNKLQKNATIAGYIHKPCNLRVFASLEWA